MSATRSGALLTLALCTWALAPVSLRAADTTPPIVSGVLQNAGRTTATVTWTTDEPATSKLYWEPELSGDSYGYSTPLDATFTTAHSQSMTGLYPGQPYHFRVDSKDASGNTAHAYGSFTTVAPDPSLPYDFDFVFVGPHHVVQGHQLFFDFNTHDLAGLNAAPGGIHVAYAGGIPPNCVAKFLDGQLYPTRDDWHTYGTPYGYMMLQTAANTPAGTYTVQLTATAGSLVKSGNYVVIVDPVPAALPSTPLTGAPPIPSLATWESNMKTIGLQWGKEYAAAGGAGNNAIDYDAERVFYQIADYTKDSSWNTYADYAEKFYRDEYVLPGNGGITGYYTYPHGLYRDYIRTGDTTSKAALVLMSKNSSYGYSGGSPGEARSRETAYILETYHAATDVGETKQFMTRPVDYALGHIDQWFISKTALYIKPFMVGLTMEALIEDYERTHDPRIPPAIKIAADGLWSAAWIAPDRGFYYVSSHDPLRGTPYYNLNLLIAPAYAWLYRMTGDSHYRQIGDQIFSGGVDQSYPDMSWAQKNFDQNYRWSFNYVKWRILSPSMGNTPRSDFDGDRKGDILFRHPSTGNVYLWLMR